MRLTLRLVDALRSPARLAGLARRTVEIVVRGELPAILRRLRPRSPTAAEYRAWCARQPSPPPQPSVPFVVAFETGGSAAHDLVAAASALGARAVLLRDPAGGWSRPREDARGSLAEWLAQHEAQWVWWVARPVRFASGAADAIACACAGPLARVVYADHDVADASGRPAVPVFKSAWDDEQIRECDFTGPVLVVHASLAGEVDAAAGAAGSWAFLLRARRVLPPGAFVHVPRVLAHVAARTDAAGERGTVAAIVREDAQREGLEVDIDESRRPWLRYRPRAPGGVSVVVPTRDRVPLLARCLRSVLACGSPVPLEIVIVDNGSTDPALAPLLAEIGRAVRLRCVRVDAPFNFAQLCNAGVEAAAGDVVVLLNNDAVLAGGGGLDELVALAARPGTGAVGPLLAYPDGRLQSAGVLVGVNRTATSALQGFAPDDPAVLRWCATRRRVSAVMGACVAVARRKYRAVSGMDEALAVSHNEVDLCLRLEAAGFANVFTPFARVVHDEGASRGFEVTRDERARLAAEEALFKARWSGVLAAVDPAHHPSLARVGNPFALGAPAPAPPRAGWRDAGLAVVPGTPAPRA